MDGYVNGWVFLGWALLIGATIGLAVGCRVSSTVHDLESDEVPADWWRSMWPHPLRRLHIPRRPHR